MLKKIDIKKDNIKKIQSLLSISSPQSREIEKTVVAIINDVKDRGDEALVHYTEKFEGFTPKAFRVSDSEFNEAFKQCSKELVLSLEIAAKRISEFHETQLLSNKSYSKEKIEVSTIHRPVSRAGCYVPGGRASYPSTVLMTAIPAVVAGVENIIICTPPGAGNKVDPATLVAARIAGVQAVYAIGGAQAVAAMAYGTETVDPVDVIVGPGNAYVATAQRVVSQHVGIAAAYAGPSEIVVIADKSANPTFAAIDLIVQAEHGPDGQSWLISPEAETLEAILNEIKNLVSKSKRREEIISTFESGGFAVLVDDLHQAFKVANLVAPEHLQLMVNEPKEYLSSVQNAGAVFLGNMAPASVGDYFAGPSHVLPTDGSARFASALTVSDFIKDIHVIAMDESALRKAASTIRTIAEAEGLEAHAESIRLRTEGIK